MPTFSPGDRVSLPRSGTVLGAPDTQDYGTVRSVPSATETTVRWDRTGATNTHRTRDLTALRLPPAAPSAASRKGLFRRVSR